MISKDQIKAEIDKVPDEQLDRLYSIIRDYSSRVISNGGHSLMSKLQDIKIDAPADFAENIDLYLSGEKTIG